MNKGLRTWLENQKVVVYMGFSKIEFQIESNETERKFETCGLYLGLNIGITLHTLKALESSLKKMTYLVML